MSVCCRRKAGSREGDMVQQVYAAWVGSRNWTLDVRWCTLTPDSNKAGAYSAWLTQKEPLGR